MERRMDEQDILWEVGIHRDAYRGSWTYERSSDAQNGKVSLIIYYEVCENDIALDIKHWHSIPHGRTVLNGLLSSMKLEEPLPLPEVQNGRYHFFNALKPFASSSPKEITAAASSSIMNWTLALWDEDGKTIYIIKYRT